MNEPGKLPLPFSIRIPIREKEFRCQLLNPYAPDSKYTKPMQSASCLIFCFDLSTKIDPKQFIQSHLEKVQNWKEKEIIIFIVKRHNTVHKNILPNALSDYAITIGCKGIIDFTSINICCLYSVIHKRPEREDKIDMLPYKRAILEILEQHLFPITSTLGNPTSTTDITFPHLPSQKNVFEDDTR